MFSCDIMAFIDRCMKTSVWSKKSSLSIYNGVSVNSVTETLEKGKINFEIWR